jgi:hypothetical protein
MKPKLLLVWMLSIVISITNLHAQGLAKSKSFNIPLSKTLEIVSDESDPDIRILKKVLPKPHPGADRLAVATVKEALEKHRSPSGARHDQSPNKSQAADAPVMYRNFQGNNFNGFVPNDNDMAISNGEIVCSVTNTSIWSRDLNTGLSYGTYNLHTLTQSLGLQQEEFDPKVMYDPVSDRFILVCLNGFTDSTSNILVGFSQGPSSYGSWNFYSLPGDPLNNTLWTDFPMMALTEDELIITVNLLYNDSTWQAGFNQTVIWQISKNEGYSGQPLNPLLHYDIKYNNEPIRNLCPVKGGRTLYGPEMNFISNRNFSSGNDTIFLVQLSGLISSSPTVSVDVLESNINYRMPIDAQQPFQDLLIVNDARVLGAYLENNQIQFVFNMLDTVAGKTGIYHGIINLTPTPSLSANVYAIDTLYMAYPNIAYAGNGPGDNRSIVSVLISSSTIQPGVAAFQIDNNIDYSPLTVVKPGVSYTNMLVGNERWGDYTGCQTRYNLPGWVWVSGSYSIVNHTTRTWIGELGVNTGVSVPEIGVPAAESSVFPNPAQERVSFKFKLEKSSAVTVRIINTEGKLIKTVYRGSLAAGENEISLQTGFLSKGIYFLQMQDESGATVINEKLSVQ